MDDDDWLERMARVHPLHAAVAADDRDAVSALLASGADPDAPDEEGWTSLMWALSANVAVLLLTAGANPGYETEWGDSVLMAISRRADPATVAVILDAGIDPDAADNTGNVALGEAASAGNLATVAFLIQRGANVNVATLSGETPIWAAARGGHLEVVLVLLDAGAATDKRLRLGPLSGKSVADMAEAEGHHEIADVLRRS